MRNFDESNITDAVLERVAEAREPRVKQVSELLVRHLHNFVREVRPTQAEWESAIGFLTRVGQMCDDKRQEFILLSDTLGVSMLVDAINHRNSTTTTDTTVMGPFYVEGPAVHVLGDDISPGVEGVPLFVSGTVKDTSSAPLANATVDVWHSDNDGFYDVQKAGDEPSMRARFHADANGHFRFWTIQPAAYPVPHDGPVGDMLKAQGRHPWRPAHLHFMIDAPNYERLVTHVFVAGDKYLDSDVVFGVKDSLIRTFEPQAPGKAPDGRAMREPFATLHYDFVLDRQHA